MPDIVQPNPISKVVTDSGVASAEFYRWMTQITANDLIIGTGSPEGVIEATIGREYMDDAGLAGAVKFIKQLPDIAGDRTMGWVAI